MLEESSASQALIIINEEKIMRKIIRTNPMVITENHLNKVTNQCNHQVMIWDVLRQERIKCY